MTDKELLNAIIDNLLVAESCFTVIKYLLYIGFNEEKLSEYGFNKNDIKECIYEMNHLTDYECIAPIFV